MRNPGIFCTILGLVLIVNMGIISAQIPVMGKIYNSDYSGVISDASVIIYCGSNSLNTTSFDDGAYVVKFEPEVCSYSMNIRVEANKGNLVGSNTGILIECDGTNCTGDYFSIVNLNLKVQTPSSSSSSSSSSSGGGGFYIGYFNCGNNKCDTGETEKTCSKDCVKETFANNITELRFNEIPKEETNQTPEITNQEDKKGNFVWGITGAVIGFSKTKTGIGFGSLIVVLIIVMVAILINKNKVDTAQS